MSAEVRVATPADLETLLPLVQEFWRIERLPWNEPRVRRALAGILGDAAFGRVWLIERAGAPIGYLVLTLGYSLEYLGRDAFVDELYVREAERGSGVGQRALRLAEQACAELGVGALHLEVDHTNPRARALYEREGYVAHQRALMTKPIG